MSILSNVTKNWTVKRAIYTGLGLLVIYGSSNPIDGIGIVLGGYMLAMGLFSLGCASSSGCNINPATNKNP